MKYQELNVYCPKVNCPIDCIEHTQKSYQKRSTPKTEKKCLPNFREKFDTYQFGTKLARDRLRRRPSDNWCKLHACNATLKRHPLSIFLSLSSERSSLSVLDTRSQHLISLYRVCYLILFRLRVNTIKTRCTKRLVKIIAF